MFVSVSVRLFSIIDSCKSVVFEARLKRPRPHLDDKILTAWNGLMISGEKLFLIIF